MLSLLKKVVSFLFQKRKYIFLILSLAVCFFVLRFPLNDWLGRSLRNVQKQSPITRDIVFDNLKLKWFPPGLFFQDISFSYRNKRSYLDSALISLSLKDWMAFKKGFNFKLKQGQSVLFLNFKQKLASPKEESLEDQVQELYFIKGSSRLINLKDLSFLYPNMSGDLRIQFSYKGSVEDIENMTGELNLTGKNVNFSELKLNTLLGSLNLPSIEWTKVELKLEIKEGELIFKKIDLGSSRDELKIKMRGSGAFRYFRRSFRLNSYNIELQIDLDKKREFGFLDLMFANYKKEIQSKFYRYSVRLIGQGSQVPKIEELEAF